MEPSRFMTRLIEKRLPMGDGSDRSVTANIELNAYKEERTFERLSRGEQPCSTARPANLQSACQRPNGLLSYYFLLHGGRAALVSNYRSDAPVLGQPDPRWYSSLRFGGHKRANLRRRAVGATQEAERTVLAFVFFFVARFVVVEFSDLAGVVKSVVELLPRPATSSSNETSKTSQRRSRARTEIPLPFSNPCQWARWNPCVAIMSRSDHARSMRIWRSFVPSSTRNCSCE